ncbi:MAG: hypothetical protein ABS70_03110 [Nitrospira sp. SCN 59-13]|nr:MAG: hypothetical protein ABS70_03110 [Nitrospira sp. SCN 59-13]
MTQESIQGLSAAAMLEVWEQGSGRHPLDQALLLLRYGFPEEPFEAMCEWSIGQRDAHLFALRRQTIGDHIAAYAECPACRNGLEFELSCSALLASVPTSVTTWTTVEQDGRVWELRGPNSRDLALATSVADPAQARRVILSRCVRNGTEDAAEVWTGADETALAGRLSELDPLAEVLIDLRCEQCGEGWQAPFDIVTFFWNELQSRSRRLVQEVDLLARTYGWTEGEVLRLSEQRRGLYVEMALS